MYSKEFFLHPAIERFQSHERSERRNCRGERKQLEIEDRLEIRTLYCSTFESNSFTSQIPPTHHFLLQILPCFMQNYYQLHNEINIRFIVSSRFTFFPSCSHAFFHLSDTNNEIISHSLAVHFII